MHVPIHEEQQALFGGFQHLKDYSSKRGDSVLASNFNRSPVINVHVGLYSRGFQYN